MVLICLFTDIPETFLKPKVNSFKVTIKLNPELTYFIAETLIGCCLLAYPPLELMLFAPVTLVEILFKRPDPQSAPKAIY